MSKVEFLDRSKSSKCYICGGTGIKDVENLKNITKCPICTACKGTGKYKKDNYILIATDNKGQKIAFQVDSLV